jgi:hypothetical protein
MKNYKLLLSAMVGLALILVNSSAMADDKSGVATLVRLVGNAEYSLDGGHNWIPAVVGKDFQPGTIVRTEDKSLADLLIGQSLPDRNVRLLQYNTRHNPAPNTPPEIEKNMVRLQPNTILGVDKLTVPDSDPTVVSDCELNLKKGRILASVRKVSPSSEYLVKIPNGVAAVRGTQFALSVEGADVSCQVVSGTVWLSFMLVDANGNPRTDSSGNPFPAIQLSIAPGQEINLTQQLLNSFNALVAPGGNTTENLQALIQQIETLGASSIMTLPSDQFSPLQQFFKGLQTLGITITAPPGTIPPGTLPPDTGAPVHVSSL